MRGWCLTDSFIEDFKALHCFSQLKVIRIMVNATMKRVILESQVSRDLTGNIISWIRSFRQTLAVQFDTKSKQSDWLLKIRSNLIAYWSNGVTTLGKTRVAFVYKMNPPVQFSCTDQDDDLLRNKVYEEDEEKEKQVRVPLKAHCYPTLFKMSTQTHLSNQ